MWRHSFLHASFNITKSRYSWATMCENPSFVLPHLKQETCSHSWQANNANTGFHFRTQSPCDCSTQRSEKQLRDVNGNDYGVWGGRADKIMTSIFVLSPLLWAVQILFMHDTTVCFLWSDRGGLQPPQGRLLFFFRCDLLFILAECFHKAAAVEMSKEKATRETGRFPRSSCRLLPLAVSAGWSSHQPSQWGSYISWHLW